MLTDDDMVELRDTIRRLECRATSSFDETTTAQEGAKAQLELFTKAIELVESYRKRGTHPWLDEIADRVYKNYDVSFQHLKAISVRQND